MTLPSPPGRQVVATGGTIQSVWGNALWDQSVNVFASLTALTSGWTSPPTGAIAYLQDQDLLVTKVAAGWVYLPSIDMQSASTVTGTNAASVFHIDFPRAFSAIPAVVIEMGDSPNGFVFPNVMAATVAATGFSGQMRTAVGGYPGGLFRINWTAVLM